ncbi:MULTISPECIES: hypothetical protein [unclassified Paenibacillus]|uniref:hypothetical protein n=1 Tax=unclassified Paenibacillus TaxID=185978 RepID=UPI0009571B63|nr:MULTISPECIES: hypothetical protein [unclassified Paenibacillus]ASS66395.1 hypothetical protein CIC07_09695 [Paenibacillus sp. RUD330]SIQ05707.1 hypothetical protein SAMN05880555_0481 [Paenibacillus sp. RU4X]SIQ25847.1 hypothetical protein SAMN05880570_0480 [Paenibacillus sp. RU4T]
MLQQAMQKLQAETVANQKNKYIQVIGAFLMKHLESHPEHATGIIEEGKSILGSLDAMKAEAKKQASNGVGVLTDEEGFAIVLQYFGVKPPEAEPVAAAIASPVFKSTLDDLL